MLPKEFAEAFAVARDQGIPLEEAEKSVLGFTHCESGRFLAERWELSADLCDVVALHQSDYESSEHAGLIALMDISDLLCRTSAIGPSLRYTETNHPSDATPLKCLNRGSEKPEQIQTRWVFCYFGNVKTVL